MAYHPGWGLRQCEQCEQCAAAATTPPWLRYTGLLGPLIPSVLLHVRAAAMFIISRVDNNYRWIYLKQSYR